MRYVVTLVLVALLVAACEDTPSPSDVSPARPPSESSGPVRIDEQVQQLALSVIKGYSEVVDAAISQDGRKLSLAIVVRSATSKARAKELGDNFVRSVKSFSPDAPPSKDIGTGMYDYLVTVVYPDEAIVAQGAKASNSARITW